MLVKKILEEEMRQMWPADDTMTLNLAAEGPEKSGVFSGRWWRGWPLPELRRNSLGKNFPLYPANSERRPHVQQPYAYFIPIGT